MSKLPDGRARLGQASPLPPVFTPMARPALLALLLAAVLPLTGASCGTASSTGDATPSDTLALRTDSLLISVDSLRFTVAIGYPQLTGATATVPAERVAAVNAAIRDSVAAIAERFRPEQAVAPEDRDSPAFAAEVSGEALDVRLHGDVLSGLLEVYAFTGGAHGNTFYTPLAVDLRTGAPFALADAFVPGTPWADTLSAHAGRALVSAMRAGDDPPSVDEARSTLYAEGYDAAAMQRVAFALGADSLTLQFAPYEVAYYAFGAPTVPVAYRDLEAFLKPDGPVARIR